MKLTNRTKWNTKDLRKLCNAVIKHKGSQHKKHRIVVTTRGRAGYSGEAYVGGNWIEMKVPAVTHETWIPQYSKTEMTTGSDGKKYKKILRFDKPRVATIFEVERFARVLSHEIDHNLGLMHDEMISCWKIKTDYVKDFKVEPQQPKEKKKRNLKKERYEKARKKVKELKTKFKRTQNLLKKWQKKVRYYEASSAPSQTPAMKS